MSDPFGNHSAALTSPAEHAAPVFPSNTADLPVSSRALFVGSPGTVKVTMVGGETVTFQELAAGFHPIRVRRVWADQLTAGNLLAVW